MTILYSYINLLQLPGISMTRQYHNFLKILVKLIAKKQKNDNCDRQSIMNFTLFVKYHFHHFYKLATIYKAANHLRRISYQYALIICNVNVS